MAAANSSNPPETTLALTDPGSGEPISRRWRIEVVKGPDRGKVIEHSGGTLTVGSHERADLSLTDPSVSRQHAELRLLSEGIYVVDQDSKNGIRLGSAKVDRVLVPSGGSIWAGKTELRFTAIDKKSEAATLDRFGEFFTRVPATQRMLGQLRLVAGSEATILLEGETGTGKELLATAIHKASARAGGPLVVVDCGSITPTLLESNLFGHLKGAFTGASEARIGAFEAASGGTVFLDEIGELPLDLQPKLLRAIEARTVRRLGDVTDRRIDVRFVAATHRNLAQMVKAGTFREDLYYRLAVVRARVPPLRERADDIPLLANLAASKHQPPKSISAPALSVLTSAEWPGNARELRNVLERALALCQGPIIEVADLFGADPEEAPRSFHAAKEELLLDFERRYVKGLLARHQDNVSSAAREAGLSRNALYSLMKRAGIDGITEE